MFSFASKERRALPSCKKNRPRVCLTVENLEDRQVPSATANFVPAAQPAYASAAPKFSLPWTFDTVYDVSQIRTAYGFNQVGLNGSGQTIAIVDAFDAPNIVSDLQNFDAVNQIPNAPQFTVLKEHANLAFENANANAPGFGAGPSYNQDWEKEISLDVEWAHAIAPGANLVLLETFDNKHLFDGVSQARTLPGVSVVSMSWGSSEFAGETSFDSFFTTPQGHTPITFVAATGDTGGELQYPAVSPNVLAVGGTTLNLHDNNTYSSESAWSSGGGGVSVFETRPAYQNGVHTYSQRTVPDVAYDADPGTGFDVYMQSNDGFFSGPGLDLAGTSAGTPQWAALIALTNQGRASAGKPALANAVQDIYQLSQSDFHDVTDGYNGHYAHAGYDLATGRGTPQAALIVGDLTNAEPQWHIIFPVSGVYQVVLSQPTGPTSLVPVSGITQARAVFTSSVAPGLPQTGATLEHGWSDGATDLAALLAKVRVQAAAASGTSFADVLESEWAAR